MKKSKKKSVFEPFSPQDQNWRKAETLTQAQLDKLLARLLDWEISDYAIKSILADMSKKWE